MPDQNFFEKLTSAVAARDSLLCVGLDPTVQGLPARYRGPDEPVIAGLLRWNQAIIEATAELACIYKPNIAFYEALGEPGRELLEGTLAAIPADIPVLLDAKRGDIGSTAEAYATACFDIWGADAVTINPYMGRDSVQPFLDYTNKGIFLLCHTSNPGAADFQHLEIYDWDTLDREGNVPLYIHVARTVRYWAPHVALVVGATNPNAMQAVRAAAPDSWILVPGVGAQGGELEATLRAGLWSDGQGLLINVSRGISQSDDPARAAREFRETINQGRREQKRIYAGADTSRPPIAAATSSATTKTDSFLADLTVGLAELGSIKFGSFTLASGIQSPIYIDLRLLVSDPPLLALAAQAYAQQIRDLVCDRIAGVPYAALPIGTAVALHTGIPLIYPRKEVKAYGLGKNIEGNWHAGERVVVIEDLITSGGSIIQSAETLRAAGLVIDDAVVLIDREQGGTEKLAAAGIRAHSVFRMRDILHTLQQAGTISAETANEVRSFLAESKAK